MTESRDNPQHDTVIHAKHGAFGTHAPGCPRCEQKAQEDFETQSWVRDVNTNMIPALADSAYMMTLVPTDSDELDVMFSTQLGAAIMLNKPILALVAPGRKIPPKLELIADKIIYGDPADPADHDRIGQEIVEFQNALPEDA